MTQKTKVVSFFVSLFLVMTLFPASVFAADEQVVNILSWEGYIDADTLADFEDETGIRVIWSPMDSIDSMLLKVTQGGGADYDLILSSDYSLNILREQGLHQRRGHHSGQRANGPQSRQRRTVRRHHSAGRAGRTGGGQQQIRQKFPGGHWAAGLRGHHHHRRRAEQGIR